MQLNACVRKHSDFCFCGRICWFLAVASLFLLSDCPHPLSSEREGRMDGGREGEREIHTD